MRAEVGLGLQANKRREEYGRIATLAEQAGFDVVSVFGDLLFQPPIYPLLEIARVTSRVRLGAACWNPYMLHPYEIAGQLAVLDQASAGRAYLGLARGSWLDVLDVRPTRPVTHVREAVQVIYALLRDDGEGVDGDVFRLRPGTRLRYGLPSRLPRLLIGAWGPRMSALAGEIADEVKIGGSANPSMVAVMAERLARGRAAAGRAVDAVGIVAGAVTVVDEDGAAARARARTEVAMYLDVVAQLDPTVALPPDLLPMVRKHLAVGDHERAGACIPGDVLDLFAFAGTPEQVAARAQALYDAGAQRVEFGAPHGLTTTGGVELLGRRVLPLLEPGERSDDV